MPGREAPMSTKKREQLRKGQACRECQSAKRKCSGELPCARCVNMGIECTRSLKRTVRSTEDTSSSEQLSNALVVAPATPVPSFPMYKTAWDEDERIRAQVSMLVRYAEGAIRDARTLMASFGIKLRSNYIACEAPRSSWLSAREAFRSAVVVGGECDGTIPQFSGPIDRVVGRKLADFCMPEEREEDMVILRRLTGTPFSLTTATYTKQVVTMGGSAWEVMLDSYCLCDESGNAKWVIAGVREVLGCVVPPATPQLEPAMTTSDDAPMLSLSGVFESALLWPELSSGLVVE